MKIVIFGLSISSAWGNGHATLLRGLFRSLSSLGHTVHFFERDTAYYAAHRDATSFPYAKLQLYSDWPTVVAEAKQALATADVAMVTSYCPDGAAACDLVLESAVPRKTFYDLDTPVTISRLENGETVNYLPPTGFADFDQVFSYTGGLALDHLRSKLGARNVASLYGWVDPAVHFRVGPSPRFQGDFSYIGTYAADRQSAVNELFLGPAGQLAARTFVIAGAMYPSTTAWPVNIHHFEHVTPPEHSAFYSSSPLTLNVTRATMAGMGYCPSGRLFEAAACGTAVLSDWWTGLDDFFEPGQEILIASTKTEAIAAIRRDASEIAAIGRRAQERALDCHTADVRARRLLDLIEDPRNEVCASVPKVALSRGA